MALQFNQFFIKRHITSFSILVFLAAFVTIQMFRPRFMYNEDGSLRQFGIGFQRKTVIPAWLVAIVVAILSYLLVLYASTPLISW
jgi:amino acid transporter